MSGKVAEMVDGIVEQDLIAKQISQMWDTYSRQRQGWLDKMLELRNYVFATDTRTTSNSALPWKNSTTLPKLCQIADNLHANYLAAIMPNDDWLQWEAYSPDDETLNKKNAIEAYISNKLRMSGIRDTNSKMLRDYILSGMVFGEAVWVDERKKDPVTGETIQGYVGPKLVKISPQDIVFNPTAADFEHTFKIVRYVKTLGELMADAEDHPEQSVFREVVAKCADNRRIAASIKADDFNKVQAFSVDGFGSLYEYLQSGYVELLRFEGDLFDQTTGELHRNQRIYIVDRSYVLSMEDLPNWTVGSAIRATGWRPRPDNLYAMGPLDNLVGMQYRIDHLENLKADVFDMIAAPPLKIRGDVEEFVWAPGAVIHLDEEGDIEVMAPDTQALNADLQIQLLENKMEEFAGAPKSAMGIRTPGEKTAYEYQSLENAAGRIFEEKTTSYEANFLEKLINDCLELSKRHLNMADTVRVMDDDLGVAQFLTITKEDITANGVIRPVGARHFAAQARLVQNLNGLFNGPVGQIISPHISSKKLSRMLEASLNLERFGLIQPNIALFEQQETAQLAQELQEQLAVDAQTDPAGDLPSDPNVV